MARADARAVAALDRLLAAERAAILQGRADALDDLARRKAALVARLSVEAGDSATLVQMRAALARQDRVIAAARRGAEAARDAARDAAPLVTYGPDGAADAGSPRGGRIARRV